MDKVRPYMFYIVCGVLLIVEFVVMAVFGPSHERAPGSTVADTKDAADLAYRNELTKEEPPLGLELRADNTLARGGLPVPEIQRKPEKPEDVTYILDNFVVHRSWENRFEDVVDDYEGQLRGIQSQLTERSEPLSEVVSTSTDPGQWYQAYLGRSVAILRQALDNDVMIPPSSAGPARDGAPPTWTRTELEEETDLRGVIGLYTSPGQFPPTTQHPQLTTQVNVVARVVDALVRAPVAAERNPNLPTEGDMRIPPPEAERPARVVRLNWGGSQPSDMRGATLHRFNLTLRGTPSSLLSALARLDSLTNPIVVRLGASWRQVSDRSTGRSSPRGGRRSTPARQRSDGMMEVRAAFVVLDYRELEGVDLAAVASDDAAEAP